MTARRAAVIVLISLLSFVGCAKKQDTAPPPELSPVGKEVWELYADALSHRYITNCLWTVMAVSEREEEPVLPVALEVVRGFPAAWGMVKFFSEAPERFQDDPEHWFERWVFWRAWGKLFVHFPGVDEERLGYIKRVTNERFAEIADSYAPAAAVKAQLLLARSSEEPDALGGVLRCADLLTSLDSGNGFAYIFNLSVAIRRGQRSLARDYLHLAAQAPRFEYPATTAYKALIRHWVELHEEIPDGLMAYYFAHSSNAGIYWSGRFVKYLATEEGDDVQFMSDLPDLRKLVVRVGTGKPWGPPVQRLAMAVSLSRLHERALKAYVRAGNVDAIESKAPRLGCKLPQRILHKACDFAGWASSLDELLRVQTGKSWADTVSLSSYLRLSEFGLTDKWQRDIGNYMAEEYPPLYPEGNSAEPPAHTP